MPERAHDFDWLVVGSGFGGSVTALRLGKGVPRRARMRPRFADDELPKSTGTCAVLLRAHRDAASSVSIFKTS